MGCSGSKESVTPASGHEHTVAVESSPAAEPTKMKKMQSRGNVLPRVQSKRIFEAEANNSPHPVSKSVGRKQKRGSVTKAHGMSFTEVNLPAEQVISIKHADDIQKDADADESGDDAVSEAVPGAAEEDAPSAADREVQERVYKAVTEGITQVVALMAAEPDSPVLQCWCADGIASLGAGHEDNRKAVDEAGGVELVIAAMKRFPTDNSVTLKCCWALSSLSGDFAEKIGNMGGVELVVSAVRDTDDYQLSSVGVRTLHNMCELSANNTKRARAAGAKAAVEGVVTRHPDDGQLLYRCQTLLKTLKPLQSGQSVRMSRFESKRLFSEEGDGGDSPLAVSESVGRRQKRGSVTKAHGMSFTEMALPAEQVISMHTEKLVKHHTKEELLATQEEKESTVADKVYEAIPKGVPAILALMKDDPSNEAMQWWCCDALASLTVGSEENQGTVHSEGGMDLIITAMRTFPDSSQVASKAMWALANLCATQAAALGDAGAVEAVVTSAQLVDEHEVQAVFIRCMTNLISEEANLKRAVAAGAGKVVREVMEANATNGQLLFRADRLREALEAVEDEETLETLVPEDFDTTPLESDIVDSSKKIPATSTSAAAAGAGSGAAEGEAAASGGTGMRRIESKRLFGPGAPSTPKPTNVGRRQRRGSVSKAHGMSFTEIKLPTDQVLSLHAQQALRTHVEGDSSGDEAEAEAEAEAEEEAKEQTPEQIIYKAALEGPAQVIAAMTAAPTDKALQYLGSDALASLSAGNEDNRATIKANGGLELIVKAMQAWPENLTVQLKGCWAVANLAGDFAEALGELGAVDAVVAVLGHDDYQCRSVGVRALYNLCTLEANANKARRLGAADVVEDILESHAEDGQLVFRTNNLLAVLQEEEEEVTVME